MIIHISGSPCSGKSTFGKQIKSSNKSIIVKDLDDIFDKYFESLVNKKFTIYIYILLLDYI